MGIGSQEAWKLYDMKIKYFTKTLTDDSMFNNLSKLYDSEDFIHLIGDIVISDTLFSSLISSFLFDIPLTDIIPVNLEFRVELPTTDEFIHGTLIKLVPVRVEILVPEVKEALKEPTQFLIPEIANEMKPTSISKCIWGKSSYGNCYVDPIAVREFLRSSVLAFTKKPYDIVTARNMVKAATESLGINEDVVRDVFNRLTATSISKYQAFTWDYSWWDITNWGIEGSPGKIYIINYDLKTMEMEYEDLFDTTAGGQWDVNIWDFFYWESTEPVLMHPFKSEDTSIKQVQEAVVTNFRSRIPTTAFAIANYQTPEERSSFTKSSRVETFAIPTSHRLQIEGIVKQLLESKGLSLSPVEERMYINSALEIYGALSSPHKWGYEMHRAMSDDELHDYWIDKYTSLGLDESILEEIWSRVKPTIDALIGVRIRDRLRYLQMKHIGR